MICSLQNPLCDRNEPIDLLEIDCEKVEEEADYDSYEYMDWEAGNFYLV